MLFLTAIQALFFGTLLEPPAPSAAPAAPAAPLEAEVVSRRSARELPHYLRLHAASISVDQTALQAFARSGGGVLRSVPIDASTSIDLELRAKSPWAPEAAVAVFADGRPRFRPAPGRGVYLSGSIVGQPDSTAFLASTPAGVFGFVEWGLDRWIISSGPLGSGLPTVSYRVSDLPPGLIVSPPWGCETLSAPDAGSPPTTEGGVAGAACRQLRIAFDTDHDLFLQFGGDLEALEGYVGTVAAALDTILSRDLSMQVSATHLRIFAEPDDPWPDTTANAQIAALFAAWEPELDSIPRDAVQLLCAADIGGGIAYIDGLCSNYAYSVAGNITGFFPTPILDNSSQNWDIFVSAHEVGHNISMPHTHGTTPAADGCGDSPQDCSVAFNEAGTLMSYCHLCPGGISNIRLEFHPLSIARAEAYLASIPCDYTGATQPPIAVADTAMVFPGAPAAIDVLANEWDGNCEAITISSFSASSVRGASITRRVGSGPGGRDELVYAIARGGWVGPDSFSYAVTDASGQSASAIVLVEVLDPLAPENPIGTVPGLNADYFAITSETTLPDYDQRTSYASAVVESIGFSPTSGAFASSGRSDDVGARFSGWITVPESGVWDFQLGSDEGARVSIGDRVVVNHDGLHGFSTRVGTIALDAGTHAIKVDYFERSGPAGLRLSWRSPDGIAAVVPASAFSRGGADVRADLNNDARVNAADVTILLAAWGTANAAVDLTGDGFVGAQDLAAVLFAWTG